MINLNSRLVGTRLRLLLLPLPRPLLRRPRRQPRSRLLPLRLQRHLLPLRQPRSRPLRRLLLLLPRHPSRWARNLCLWQLSQRSVPSRQRPSSGARWSIPRCLRRGFLVCSMIGRPRLWRARWLASSALMVPSSLGRLSRRLASSTRMPGRLS